VIDETLFDAEEKMEKAVSVLKEELSTVRTGRATPSMFSRIHVEYYGQPTPLNQMAAINIPEARMAIVKPFDVSQLASIERSIRDSDLGVNPSNDGTIIRVVFPQLSQERRKDMVKLVKTKGEDAKISIRNVRRKAKEELDRIQKDGEAGEDEVVRAEKELQHVTDRYVAQVDDLVKHKEAELLEV
jgi:ribosome recycling factor